MIAARVISGDRCFLIFGTSSMPLIVTSVSNAETQHRSDPLLYKPVNLLHSIVENLLERTRTRFDIFPPVFSSRTPRCETAQASHERSWELDRFGADSRVTFQDQDVQQLPQLTAP